MRKTFSRLHPIPEDAELHDLKPIYVYMRPATLVEISKNFDSCSGRHPEWQSFIDNIKCNDHCPIVALTVVGQVVILRPDPLKAIPTMRQWVDEFMFLPGFIPRDSLAECNAGILFRAAEYHLVLQKYVNISDTAIFIAKLVEQNIILNSATLFGPSKKFKSIMVELLEGVRECLIFSSEPNTKPGISLIDYLLTTYT
jgi:hypothetical protein